MGHQLAEQPSQGACDNRYARVGPEDPGLVLPFFRHLSSLHGVLALPWQQPSLLQPAIQVQDLQFKGLRDPLLSHVAALCGLQLLPERQSEPSPMIEVARSGLSSG